MPKPTRQAWLDSLGASELEFLLHDWRFWARDDQLPPDHDGWRTWLLIGGRGAGKTRAGAEWVRSLVEGATPLERGRLSRIALVGETYADVREVMIDGPSGLRAIGPADRRPVYEASRRRLVWPNGAQAAAFSAEDPDGLRGPQHEAAWGDEACKWRYADETWSNLQLGLRLGDRPRQAVTTTPRPTAFLKRLSADPATAISRMTTFDNAAHLAAGFIDGIAAALDGTHLGRQELYGEIVEEAEGALWRLADIDGARRDEAPDLARIVVAVDPPASVGARADECGVIVAGADYGTGPERMFYVLEDASLQGARPSVWAARAVDAYRRWRADRIVAEANQGGEMVRSVIAQADADAPVRLVRARRGKRLRAEPVAALYEQGRVRHVGVFARLEDQMTAFTGAGAGRSPDRVDALVWALTELMARSAEPVMRRL